MTVRAIFRWQNADSTADLNNRFNQLVEKGLLWGGAVTPGVGLQVTLAQFVAVSHEGLTVVSDAVETLTVAAGQTNVVVAYVKYNPFGVPAAPIEQIQVFDSVTYNAHPDKIYMNVLAEIILAPAAVVVNLGDISFLNRDEVTPVSRSQFRGTILFAALPYPTSPTNRIGDFYWVPDKKVFYFWTGVTWEPINTGSYNSEVLLHNNQLAESELRRKAEGWGVVGGILRDPTNEYSSVPTVGIGSPVVPSVLRVEPFGAYLNGHYVETRREDVTLGPAPLLADQFDLVFLEIWRENVIDPGTVVYKNSAGVNYTLEQASDIAEQNLWAPATTAFDLHEINVRNHVFNNVCFRFSYVSNVSPECLFKYDTAAGAATNIDGNPFSCYWRFWEASAPSKLDGKSYAIPLFVIRRYVGEPWIREFNSGIRYVFPVYSLADTSNMVKQEFDAEYWKNDPAARVNNTASTTMAGLKASGFISGNKSELKTVGAANSIRWCDLTQPPIVRCFGFEDAPQLAQDADLGVAPGAGWSRQLVYLQMSVTMFSDAGSAVAAPSTRLFPFIKSVEGSDFDFFGWRRGTVTWELKVGNLGASTATDEDEAFTALGWSKYPGDGGLWYKALLGYYTSSDYRIHITDAYYAIPICLVHRRNSAAWNFNTNPNGSGVGRPDGRTSASTIYPDDILADLRHSVDISDDDLKSLLESSIDKLMKGQLRTRGANRYTGSGLTGEVGGSRILQSDSIGAVAGAMQLTTGDSNRRIWSDAKEYQPVTARFRLSDGFPVPESKTGCFTYSRTGTPGTAGAYGTLDIEAPAGSYLIRHIPGVTYCGDDPATPTTYMNFYGPPCWVSRTAPWSVYETSAAAAKYVNVTGYFEKYLPFCPYPAPGTSMAANVQYQPFAETAWDNFGRATKMRGYIDLSAAAPPDDAWGDRYATLSWWVCYDRGFAAPYNVNYGLTEVPDVVHKAILAPSTIAADLNIGPNCLTVRAPCAGLTFQVTSAMVDALTGLGGIGTTTLVGVDITTLAFSAASSAVVSSVTLDQATQTTITVGLTVAFAGNVDIVVFYRNSAERPGWIEVGRGGKSVQARWNWATTDVTIADIVEDHCTLSLTGDQIWAQVEYAGRRLSCMPFIWHRNGIGADWSLYLYDTTVGPSLYDLSKADYEYSNILTFPIDPIKNLGSTLLHIVYPTQAPPTSAANNQILIHYTYTPYQGLSSDGGRAATIGPALTKLKGMLHGAVLEDSDWYATQSGPCSYFSGVHAFSGLPVNRAPVRKSLLPGFYIREFSYLQGMFPEYNSTWLVRPPNTSTYYNLEASGVFNDAAQLNTPAVLRLPFPINPSMYQGVYLKGVADFDLDPCRAGSAAGYLNLAPGYMAASQGTFGGYTRTSHFSNGLSPFAASLVQGFSRSYAGMDYSLLSSSGITVQKDRLRNSGGAATLDAGLNAGGCGEQIVRTVSAFEASTANGLITEVRSLIIFPGLSTGSPYYLSETGEGTFLYSGTLGTFDRFALYSYPGGIAPVNPRALITSHPGELLQYCYAAYDPGAYFALNYYQSAIAVINQTYLYGTTVMGERGNLSRSENTPTPFTDRTYTNTFVPRIDTIRVPVAFGQNNTSSPTSFLLNSTDYTNCGQPSLKGVTIGYPSTWTAPMVTFADGLWAAASDLAARSSGRGLYCGTSSYRFAASTLVPGSGTDLPTMLRMLNLHTPNDMPAPQAYACMPAVPLFNDPVRNYFINDRGGGLAYVFRGLLINPTSSSYKGRVVLQIAGGPNGGVTINNPVVYTQGQAMFDQNSITATAIDAFWPTGRPIINKR